MAAGDMIKNRFQEFTDEQTGTRVGEAHGAGSVESPYVFFITV